MTAAQKHQLSLYALIGNLIVSGAILAYVRDNEHRLTLLEANTQTLICQANPRLCK